MNHKPMHEQGKGAEQIRVNHYRKWIDELEAQNQAAEQAEVPDEPKPHEKPAAKRKKRGSVKPPEITVEMVREAFQEGQLIKNYKCLCDALGIAVKGGQSKEAQLKVLARCCEFTRHGWYYRIVKIYDQMLPPNDGRSRRGKKTTT